MRYFPLALVLAALSTPALAQTPPVPSPVSRGDVSGTIGWFNANKENLDVDRYNDWYNSSLHGGLTAGWYWTDQLKTEVEFGASTSARIRSFSYLTVPGGNTSKPIEYTFGTRKLAISQHYQGYRNQWVHPYAAIGVETTWERISESHGATVAHDSATRTSRQILPPQTIGPYTDVTVRPFGSVGFKAYITPRSFFKSELRMAVRGGIDEVLLRVGFGLDF